MKIESRLFIKVQKSELKAKEHFSNVANVIGQKLRDLTKLSGTDITDICILNEISIYGAYKISLKSSLASTRSG